MKTRLLQKFGTMMAMALVSSAIAADPITIPLPRPQHVPEVRAGGLQVSLTTSGYKFFVPDGLPTTEPVPIITKPVRDSFSASALLQNRSSTNIEFTFDSAGAAARRFTYRLFDAAGVKIWGDDHDPTSPPEVTPATLVRGGQWKRTIQVPLKKADGKWLEAGIYTLEASVDADKQLGASAVLEVATLPKPPEDPKNTGIKGLVLRAQPPEAANPLPAELPVSGARVTVMEINPAGILNSPSIRVPFSWQGITNAEGRFEVNTPAGRFRVTVALPPSPLAVVQPPPKTMEVTVEAGRFAEVTFHFPAFYQPPQPPGREPRLISIITEVGFSAVNSSATQVTIQASGIASTSGWTEPRLRPRLTLSPFNGFLEFDFIATPPEAGATVLTPINATATVPKPDGFKGVRVFSATNSKERLVQ